MDIDKEVQHLIRRELSFDHSSHYPDSYTNSNYRYAIFRLNKLDTIHKILVWVSGAIFLGTFKPVVTVTMAWNQCFK